MLTKKRSGGNPEASARRNGNLVLILNLFLSKTKITDEKKLQKKKGKQKNSSEKRGGIKGRIEPIDHLHSHYPNGYGANKRL